MRTTTCKDCGCEIVVASVRGPMPTRCRACARKRAIDQKRKFDAARKKAGLKVVRRKSDNEIMSSRNLSSMSPVRRRIEERRRMSPGYYSFCPMP